MGTVRTPSQSGFTLIELLVALGLFSIIVSIAIGGFVSALRTQRHLVALVSANNNVSAVLEQMARELRTGSGFSPAPCSRAARCTALTFNDSVGNVVTYQYDTSSTVGVIERRSSEDFPSVFVPVTAPSVNVKFLYFITSDPSSTQPAVTILTGVTPNTNDPAISSIEVDLQTSVSSRQIQIQ